MVRTAQAGIVLALKDHASLTGHMHRIDIEGAYIAIADAPPMHHISVHEHEPRPAARLPRLNVIMHTVDNDDAGSEVASGLRGMLGIWAR